MIDAKGYTKVNNASQESVACLINEFEDKLINIFGKCMDVGCGPGDITRNILLPALDPKAIMIGTDISGDMIKCAKELNKDKERLQFEILNIETKDLPNKYVSEFDHVFSFYALHWCDDIRQALENIYHLLRPGGTCLATVLVSPNLFNTLHKMMQDMRYARYISKTNKFLSLFYGISQPERKMRELLQSVGFVINHCSHRQRNVKNVQQLLDAVFSFISLFFKNMPHNLMEQFRDNFTQEYMKAIYYNDNEKMTLDPHEFLVFHVQKKD